MAFSECQSRYFPLFTDSRHYRHSHAVSFCTVWHFHVSDGKIAIWWFILRLSWHFMPHYQSTVMQFSFKKKKNCDWICAPFTPVFWHLSELHSNSCDRALQVTLLWHTLRNSKRSTVKKKKKRLPSSTWSVCWGLSQRPAGALKFRFIKNHRTLLNYKGFILSYSSLLEAGIDVVLFVLFKIVTK